MFLISSSSFMSGYNTYVPKNSFLPMVMMSIGGIPPVPPIETKYLITDLGELLITENNDNLIYR